MLHHLEVYVSDLAKSREFYDFLLTGLGYEHYQEWENGVSFKKAEQYLVFVQTLPDFLEVGYHRCRMGLNHLAFHGVVEKKSTNFAKICWREIPPPSTMIAILMREDRTLRPLL